MSKKERLKLTRERNKLNRALGGIKGMGDLPDLMFVIDTNKESIAVREAQQLGIPVMAVLDSNSNPDDIAYPIPGNDDGARAILLYCKLISAAALDGVSEYQENAAFEADEADNAEALVEAAEEGTPAKENASAEVETPAEAASEDPEAKPEESKTEPEETP